MFITNHDKVITNYVSFAYYKLRQSVVTNYDSFFVTNYNKIITNYDRTIGGRNSKKLRSFLLPFIKLG